MPRSLRLVINLEGMTVLNAELKSANSNCAYVSLLSRCVSTEYSAVEMASSMLLLLQ